jgi:hypothetical protein
MSLSTVTYRIITASVTTNVGSFVLSTVEGLEVGVCIRAYGTGEPRLDRRHNIATIDTDTKTITFDATGPNITAFNPANASIVPLVTWVKDADVAVFLGYEPEAESIDIVYLADVVEAANDFGYRRRQQAGYIDSRCLIPNPSARQGVVLYAAALFRERGSVDSFASFQDMNIAPSIGSMGQILRLLGIPRPAVA